MTFETILKVGRNNKRFFKVYISGNRLLIQPMARVYDRHIKKWSEVLPEVLLEGVDDYDVPLRYKRRILSYIDNLMKSKPRNWRWIDVTAELTDTIFIFI